MSQTRNDGAHGGGGHRRGGRDVGRGQNREGGRRIRPEDAREGHSHRHTDERGRGEDKERLSSPGQKSRHRSASSSSGWSERSHGKDRHTDERGRGDDKERLSSSDQKSRHRSTSSSSGWSDAGHSQNREGDRRSRPEDARGGHAHRHTDEHERAREAKQARTRPRQESESSKARRASDDEEPPSKRAAHSFAFFNCERAHREGAPDVHVEPWCTMCSVMEQKLENARMGAGEPPKIPSANTRKFFKHSVIRPYKEAHRSGNYPTPTMSTYMNQFKVKFNVTPAIFKELQQEYDGSLAVPVRTELTKAQEALEAANKKATEYERQLDLTKVTIANLVAKEAAYTKELQVAVTARAQIEARATACEVRLREVCMQLGVSAEMVDPGDVNDGLSVVDPTDNPQTRAIRKAIYIRLHRKVAQFKHHHLKAGRLDPRLFVELLSTQALTLLAGLASFENKKAQCLAGLHVFLCGGKGSTSPKPSLTTDKTGIHVPADVFTDVDTSDKGEAFVFAYLTDIWLVPAAEAATGIDGRPGLVERSFNCKAFPWSLQGSAITLPAAVEFEWFGQENVVRGFGNKETGIAVARDIARSLNLMQRPCQGAPLFPDPPVNVVLGAPTDSFLPAGARQTRPDPAPRKRDGTPYHTVLDDTAQGSGSQGDHPIRARRSTHGQGWRGCELHRGGHLTSTHFATVPVVRVREITSRRHRGRGGEGVARLLPGTYRDVCRMRKAADRRRPRCRPHPIAASGVRGAPG